MIASTPEDRIICFTSTIHTRYFVANPHHLIDDVVVYMSFRTSIIYSIDLLKGWLIDFRVSRILTTAIFSVQINNSVVEVPVHSLLVVFLSRMFWLFFLLEASVYTTVRLFIQGGEWACWLPKNNTRLFHHNSYPPTFGSKASAISIPFIQLKSSILERIC